MQHRKKTFRHDIIYTIGTVIGCKVTPEGYAHMTHLLSSLANGRIIVALEGGYNLTAIAYSMTLCTKALLGDPIPSLQLKEEVDLVAVESIRNVLDTHAKYWSVLKPFRKQFPFREELIPAGKYHKVVEESEIQLLQESFHKSNLDNNNSSFESSESSCHLSEKKMDQQNNDNKEQELDAEKAGASGSTGSGSAIQLNVVVEHEDGAAGGGSGNPLTEALKTMQDSVQEVTSVSNLRNLGKIMNLKIMNHGRWRLHPFNCIKLQKAIAYFNSS